jgi:Glycosyl transferases group 1
MSVMTPQASLYRVARRAGIRRPRAKRQVPRLRVARPQPGPPTVWMITPDWNRHAGGIRKQYRAVDVLNDAGLSAAVVHKRAGFECTWFEHETRVVSAGEIAVGERDVIAVPEIYGPTILDLPAGVRQVIFNQGAYLALETLVERGPAATAPYLANPDLAAVVVVSDDSAEVMRYAFPGVPVQRIHHGIDAAVHYPPPGEPRRRIAYMPRRRGDESAQVLKLLELRGVLDDWEVVAIEGKTELEVAELLRSSRIFLSFSQLEGFGLPPLEALACGCLVVGFHGFGGRELFRSPFAVPVEDSDVVGFARAVEDVMRRVDEDPAAIAAAAAAGARFAAERYSRATERRDLLDVFAPLLES